MDKDYTISELIYYYEYIGYLLDRNVIDMQFFEAISKEGVSTEQDTQEFTRVKVQE
mgnify:CR=1 FL=1